MAPKAASSSIVLVGTSNKLGDVETLGSLQVRQLGTVIIIKPGGLEVRSDLTFPGACPAGHQNQRPILHQQMIVKREPRQDGRISRRQRCLSRLDGIRGYRRRIEIPDNSNGVSFENIFDVGKHALAIHFHLWRGIVAQSVQIDTQYRPVLSGTAQSLLPSDAAVSPVTGWDTGISGCPHAEMPKATTAMAPRTAVSRLTVAASVSRRWRYPPHPGRTSLGRRPP